MIRTLFIWVALFTLLLGCKNKTVDEFVVQAEGYVAEEKLNDAEITLKNAIKEYPRHPQLRTYLGNIYLSQGLAALAEKELGRAMELGETSTETTVNFLKALSMQQKVEDILTFTDKIEAPADELIPALNTYNGIAFYGQNFPSKARRAFLSATQTTFKNKYTKLSDAYVAFLERDVNKAIFLLDDVLEDDPTFAEALSLKGRILYNQRKFVESANALETYLEAYPNSYRVRIYYSQSLVRADMFEKADLEVSRLLRLFPNQSLLNSLKAAIEFENENFQQAKEHAERAMLYGDRQDSTVFIAGVSAMRLENYEQAYSYLESLVSDLPASHPLQKLFSIVQFKVGYFQDAADSLDSLGTIDEEDFELFSSMSYGMLKAGRVLEAKELISKAESMLDGTPESLTRIGQLKLFIEDSSGVDDLVESLERKPDQIQAILLLATAYMQKDEFDESLKLAKSWQKREPNNVEAMNLEAFTYYKKGDTEQAYAIYKASLVSHPSNYKAHLFIKNRLLLQGKLQEAAEQMESYLVRQPYDEKGLIQLYLVKNLQKDTTEALARVETAYNENPTEPLKIVLSKIYNAEKLYSKTVELLFPKNNNQGFPSFHWQTLTEALVNLNDDEKTFDIIDRWQSSFPSSVQALFYKLIVLERQGRLYEAIEVVSIWNKDRNYNEFLVKEAILNIMVNRYPEAIAVMNRISDNSAYTPAGKYVLGRIAAWSNNHVEAKKLLMESYQAIPKDDTAVWLSEQVKVVDGEDQAIEFLRNHLSKSPSDVITRTQLANLLFQESDPEAIEQYKTILKYAPENVVALNNLAWDAKQNNDLVGAENYIEQAQKYASHVPAILDTAAAIKMALGQVETARELLEKAYRIDKDNNDIAIHYAKVLIELDEPMEARSILRAITPLNEQQEIQKSDLINLLNG